MPSLEIDFDPICAKCKSPLDVEVDQCRHHGNRVFVKPCKDCMDELHTEISELQSQIIDQEE